MYIIIIFSLIILYFVIKWAVKNGIKEAYKDITGNQTNEEKELDDIIKKYSNPKANNDK